ncbi:MAG: hypothetical protein Q7V05_04235 [Methanoregula sp.]|nr:hypothetical protein [Methanoregula sp.]
MRQETRRRSFTGRGLQYGLLVDYLSRMDKFPLLGELSPRQRSVLQPGRSCGINDAHARTVTALVLGMLDSAKEQQCKRAKPSFLF